MTVVPAAPCETALPPGDARPGDGRWTVLAAAALLLAVEAGLAVLAFVPGHPLGALAGHIVVCAALAIWVRRRRRDAPDAVALRLLATTLPFFGPLAAAGAILQAVLAPLFARSTLPVERWLDLLLPGDRDDAPPAPTPGPGTGHGTLPFAGVMIAGTREQKQALLTLAGRDFEPVFASALQLALHDGNPAVRVQAAATIAKVEADIHERELELERACKAGGPATDAALALARLHEMRSRLAWQDASIRDEHRGHALRLYRECLALRPDDADLRLAVGVLLRETGRADESAAWFASDIAAGTASARTVFACMESLFDLQRFDDVRRLARDHYERMARTGELPPDALRVVEYWRAKGLLAPPGGSGP